ncbi:TRAP transporter small permease [Bosea sp. (in: a-proteobacteria)]|uniref:TRAP transporter small permease n=1 Tax=Bosea sp. (in: a-proteobacteria) TaxID=1871050 RepID=UPI002B470D7F|nr:TRAP transporter small permease [Bosea sp. (in: a-proteobacteria)]WRH60070.1 MAG: TRAP transporter small permease [Bosea sp. (in: a-proteobacteria)]
MALQAEQPEDRLAGPRIGLIARGLALTGGAILIAIAALVTVSVLCRIVTGSGIDGDFEIVQLAAAIAAFCLFPLCFAARGNIIVDTFTTRLPERARHIIDSVWDALFGFVALVLSWRMVVGAIEQRASGTTLQVYPLPTWWAVAICAVLMALLGGTAAAVGLRGLRARHVR